MFHRFDARLRRLEQQAPETAWLRTEGLAALKEIPPDATP